LAGESTVARTIDVGVLGATGAVGQQFVARLEHHPWFRLTWLAASGRSAGHRYGDLPRRLPTPCPDFARDLVVDEALPGRGPQLLFSALDAGIAEHLEPELAAAGHIVISNTRSYRMDPTVPLVVPEINADHLGLLPAQRTAHGWSGAIVTNPNCSTTILALALGALAGFGLRTVMVSTLQAVSGAGYPGVASLDLLGNVIPFIDGEEPKMECEANKILGRLADGRVEPHPLVISAQTTRVPVLDGHTELVSIAFERSPSEEDIREALSGFNGVPQREQLPSAPARPVQLLQERDRPQPRLDVTAGDGMAVSVGRVRPCPVLDWKMVVLGHNTVRGAAGGALLNAELMVAQGLVA
jgi:aspartate-semialdehyde dehydrogenase